VPISFRAGGTSLSGQSVTDGWLVDIGRHWRKIEPIDSGMKVRVQGGAIGGVVNATLRSMGRKIGPDPSSINSAMMGGILSNNSSGMCCGVANNAYHTVESIRFVLPDSSVWDTSLAGEANRFETEKPAIARELSALRAAILASPDLLAKIRRKYQQKNTVGYSLNAFVDYEKPLDILAHLLIGGEGTLAFISEAVLKTLPELPEKATALAFFPDANSACEHSVFQSTVGRTSRLSSNRSINGGEKVVTMASVVYYLVMPLEKANAC
jgi:D-lactate dehydrogenase